MVALERQQEEPDVEPDDATSSSLPPLLESSDCGSSGLTESSSEQPEDVTSSSAADSVSRSRRKSNSSSHPSPCGEASSSSCSAEEDMPATPANNNNSTSRCQHVPNQRVFTDPQQYFDELQHWRELSSTPRGILTVRSAKASCCSKDVEQLQRASRVKRHARFQKAGMSDPETVTVRFSTLQVREYPCILGDNPGGTTGPPIAMDWEHFSEVSVPVDEYEANRPERRGHAEMQMPVGYRLDLLKRCGYSRNQIIEGTKPVNIARAQRVRTRETLQLDPVHALLEKVTRKARHVVTLGARKREERKFLEPYVVMSKLTTSTPLRRNEARGERSTSPARSATSGDTVSMDFSEPETATASSSLSSSAVTRTATTTTLRFL